MSSLGSALNSAVRALEANQIGLAVASNNIANANTPGYSRQRVLMEASPNFGEAAGTGVRVTGTEAERDQLVSQRIWQETSDQSQANVTHQSLSDIEMLFNETQGTGMLPLLTGFFNSFQQLSTDPTSTNLRQQVTSSASALSDYFNQHSTELHNMQATIDRSIKSDVSQINSLATQIASLTVQITQQETTSQPANELRDQRTTLIESLSKLVNVQELDSPGTYQLSIANGRPLVFNGTAMTLTTGTSLTTGFSTVMSGTNDITSEVAGGSLSSRIALRDSVIPKYSQSLDQLASEIAQQVNAVHTASYDLNGNPGTSFFMPLTSVTDAALNLTVNAALISDPSKIAASAQSSGSDNQAAIQMGNLLTAPVFSGGSVTDQYSGIVYSIGSETSNAQLETTQHAAILQQLQNRRQEVSGVSIDEESIMILQFQRAFEASARVVKTVDDLLQVALTMGT